VQISWQSDPAATSSTNGNAEKRLGTPASSVEKALASDHEPDLSEIMDTGEEVDIEAAAGGWGDEDDRM
jgi:hypothetical protein